MATGHFHERGGLLQVGTLIPQPLDYDTGFGAVFVQRSSGCNWSDHIPMHRDPKNLGLSPSPGREAEGSKMGMVLQVGN
jgi:hypothetical protein